MGVGQRQSGLENSSALAETALHPNPSPEEQRAAALSRDHTVEVQRKRGVHAASLHENARTTNSN